MPVLDTEEYIEQAYFFRVYRERLAENVPAQDILASVHEEILSTTKLPMAIEFLKGEILLTGRVSEGMTRLGHYFTPFQTFVMQRAEEERSRFDQKIALEVLEHEAAYRAKGPTPQGLFVYQFECISRNRLGYDHGMVAMSGDPLFDEGWRDWIRKTRLRLGTVEFNEVIYYASEQHVLDRRRTEPSYAPKGAVLFGTKEGRIALANRGRDPLYMFAALQRQLGYPAVPRPKPSHSPERLIPELQRRIEQLEKRLQLVEAEQKGKLDISQFVVKPPDDFPDDVSPPPG
jgi:hypothetical protein